LSKAKELNLKSKGISLNIILFIVSKLNEKPHFKTSFKDIIVNFMDYIEQALLTCTKDERGIETIEN